MTVISENNFTAMVEAASLAPSVHNIQPARWRLQPDGQVDLLAAKGADLPAADPDGLDIGLSCGCALEAALLALGLMGYDADITHHWQDESVTIDGARHVARLSLCPTGNISKEDSLAHCLPLRQTWRKVFASIDNKTMSALESWATNGTGDCLLVKEKADLDYLADLNDATSLTFLRNGDYRAELLDWMRLNANHPRFDLDGMAYPALDMSAIEAFGAGWVLGSKLFPWLDKLGLARTLVAESTKTRTADAVLLFHRPANENPVQTGQAFLRAWLQLTRLDLVAWPMAAIANNEISNQECKTRFGLNEDRRLVNLWRVGKATGRLPKRARLPVSDLILAQPA